MFLLSKKPSINDKPIRSSGATPKFYYKQVKSISRSKKHSSLEIKLNNEEVVYDNAHSLLDFDSTNYDLTNSYQALSSKFHIGSSQDSDAELNFARAVIVNKNEALCLSHDRPNLFRLNLENKSLKEIKADTWKGKQPYTIRSCEQKLYVGFKDESTLCRMNEAVTKFKELHFCMDTLKRIWDVAIDSRTKRIFLLDTALKEVLVFDEKFNFIRKLEPHVSKHGSIQATAFQDPTKFWPRDIKIHANRLYVVDTCTCIYEFYKHRLLGVSDGGTCIRLFDSTKLGLVKSIKHKNMLRPLGLIIDRKGNILTTANFVDNYKHISAHQYLFCFNNLGRILHVTCLDIDLMSRGISDMAFISPTSLLFCCLSHGLLICNFDEKDLSVPFVN